MRTLPEYTDPRPDSIREGDELFGRPLVVGIGLFNKAIEPRILLTTENGKVVDYPISTELLTLLEAVIK